MEPWWWKHALLNYDMNWNRLLRCTYLEKIKWIQKFDHFVRESWRHKSFREFIFSERRDAAVIRASEPYKETCQLARRLFQDSNGHGKAVLIGAAASTAYYQMQRTGVVETFCFWCKKNVVPSWDHLCWQCDAFQETRPEIPDSIMQRRLGWPVISRGTIYANAVLTHLASVRAQVREDV